MRTVNFRQAGHFPSLLGALAHFEVSFLVWVLLGALGSYVASDLGLSAFQKGLMVALPPLGGAAFRLVVGSFADRVGAKRTGLVTLTATLVPLSWGWLAARTYGEVLAVGLLLGVGGASFAVALPLASRWYPPEHQGLALGIAGAGNSGTVIAALAAPRLAESVGWHAVFGLATIPIAMVAVAFAILVKEPPRPRAEPVSPLALAGESDARWFCRLYMVTFGGFVGLAAYLPLYFVDRFGLPKVSAAVLAGCCVAAGSLLRPLGGLAADRFGGLTVLLRVLVVVAGAAALASASATAAATTLLLVVLCGSLGVGNGAVFQLIPQRFGDRMGAITGLVGAAGGLGGFLLPFGLGALRQATGSFTAGFVAIGIAALAAAASVAARQRSSTPGLALEVAR